MVCLSTILWILDLDFFWLLLDLKCFGSALFACHCHVGKPVYAAMHPLVLGVARPKASRCCLLLPSADSIKCACATCKQMVGHEY